jgi:hypothetical protein
MDWVLETSGSAIRTTSEETQCAAEGHAHCVFTVRPL